ncbi:MAG: hypothetical protein KAJ79_07000 [Candidatus Omnitrophica bacterium]|nr:hypothetical protein [Candidatus Omnitrophota bacterium]MCK5288799.1 hypothetical protein [Candidatus Omnitrophota bacterium]
MLVEKDRYLVNIFCVDGSFIKGLIHVSPGLRILDSLNSQKDNFVAVVNAEIFNLREGELESLGRTTHEKGHTIILNKSAVKWMEEIKKI